MNLKRSKICLIGPSARINDLSGGWFVDRIKEGYCLVVFGVGIYPLMKFAEDTELDGEGFKPHYWCFVDPNTCISWGKNQWKEGRHIYDEEEYFKDIRLLSLDVYKDDLKIFNSLGWTCSGAKGLDPLAWDRWIRKINDGSFYDIFKSTHKYEPELLWDTSSQFLHVNDLLWKDSAPVETDMFINTFDYRQTLLLHRGPQYINSDKLTSILLPLVFKHFGSKVKEILTVGFGDTDMGRAGPHPNEKNMESLPQYLKWYSAVIPFYKKFMVNNNIKFKFAYENTYSEIYNKITHNDLLAMDHRDDHLKF